MYSDEIAMLVRNDNPNHHLQPIGIMTRADQGEYTFETIYSAFFEEKIFPDLTIVIVWLLTSVACIYLPVLNASPLRVVFAIPMILFIPGYTLIAAIFPGKEDLELIERIVLSFGLSIAMVPLCGLALNYTPYGIRLDPIVVFLTALTIVLVLISQFRRSLLATGERYEFPIIELVQGFKDDFFQSTSSRIDRVLSYILLIAIVVAIATTVYVIVVPKEGEKFTEFYILGEKKMAADYPERIVPGNVYPIFIGVGNHEFRNVSYAVETYLVRMDVDEVGDGSLVSSMSHLDTLNVTLSHNMTEVIPYNLSVPSGDYNRIEFLLYNETIPSGDITGMDRINASYRDLHLWVEIQEQD
ncbi:MAG TPA: DUF1616 domain-containing protein [Methanospirillum sp.]|nr:DUF1616 domain-containing protein [Methanospirillum sp.]